MGEARQAAMIDVSGDFHGGMVVAEEIAGRERDGGRGNGVFPE
jgi:hypothetical protein